MQKLLTSVFVLAACGGANVNDTTVLQTPRPSPATGGYQAETPPVEGWVSFGAPVETSPLQRTIHVQGAGGNIGQLYIKGVTGEAEISQIQVEYMDKGVKRIDLNMRFQPGDGQVVELREQRPISRIIVFIDPDTQGTFEVLGA